MPYCPRCNQEPESGTRCPICHVFYQERRCLECSGEVFPKEAFCVHCGGELGGRVRIATTAGLQPAGLVGRFAATMVDLVALYLLSEMLDAGFLQSPFLSVFLSVLGYYGFFQARGRQTLGQYVLRLAVLGEDRLPIRLGRSLARTALACLSWALVVPPLLALRDPARRTPVDRILHIQVFRAS